MGGIKHVYNKNKIRKGNQKSEEAWRTKRARKINMENSFDSLNQNMRNQFDKINTEFDKRLSNMDEILECRIKEIHNSINETRRRVGELEEVVKQKTVK